MPTNKEIKHETITDHCIEQLWGKDKNGNNLSYIYNKFNLEKLKHLPSAYKNQINDYLLELIAKDSSENAKTLYETVFKSLEINLSKKYKP